MAATSTAASAAATADPRLSRRPPHLRPSRLLLPPPRWLRVPEAELPGRAGESPVPHRQGGGGLPRRGQRDGRESVWAGGLDHVRRGGRTGAARGRGGAALLAPDAGRPPQPRRREGRGLLPRHRQERLRGTGDRGGQPGQPGPGVGGGEVGGLPGKGVPLRGAQLEGARAGGLRQGQAQLLRGARADGPDLGEERPSPGGLGAARWQRTGAWRRGMPKSRRSTNDDRIP